MKQTHIQIYTARFACRLYVRTVPCKTSDVSEGTVRRGPLPVRHVIEPESRNLFKPLTFQPLLENSQINFLLPKGLNLYKFSIQMRHGHNGN